MECGYGSRATNVLMTSDFQVSALNTDAWVTLIPMTPLRPGYPETRRNIFEASAYFSHKPLKTLASSLIYLGLACLDGTKLGNGLHLIGK